MLALIGLKLTSICDLQYLQASLVKATAAKGGH